MSFVAAATIGAAGIGAYSANKSAKSANAAALAQAEASKGDPRALSHIYGDGTAGNIGLLNQYKGMLDDPRSQAATGFAGANADYLSQYGKSDLDATRSAAMQAMQGSSAPMMQAAQSGAAGAGLNAYATGNMVNAPSQNGLDLKGSYDRFVSGTPGANPYLDQSIDGAIAQNRLGFGQLQDDQTKNLLQNIMPSIRSQSVLSGQYGGSRQGIAEGNAIGTTQTELARAGAMFGQNATNAAVGAKANAYETDSNRALSATQGLGAQQYGVASQDANTKNQAEFTNVGNLLDVGKFNAGLQQQTNLANAGFDQQAGLSNQAAQLSTNAQNNSALLGGAGLLSGLTQQAGQTVNANDNYELNRAQQVNGLLSPYLTNSNGGQAAQQQSVSGQTIGGALSGLALGNQLGGLLGGGGPSGATSLQTQGSAASMPTGWAPSQLPVQSFGFNW